MFKLCFALVPCMAALSMGCSHDPIVKAPGTEMTSSNATTPLVTSNVVVSGDVVRACKLHFDNVDQAPKFDFALDALTQDDRSVLAQIATCVETGPLKGQALRLVGRADPRGEVEYNFLLGEHRASSVKSYLSGHGVDAMKLVETSRGKLDATGTDEAGWARDRRVDIELKTGS